MSAELITLYGDKKPFTSKRNSCRRYSQINPYYNYPNSELMGFDIISIATTVIGAGVKVGKAIAGKVKEKKAEKAYAAASEQDFQRQLALKKAEVEAQTQAYLMQRKAETKSGLQSTMPYLLPAGIGIALFLLKKKK